MTTESTLRPYGDPEPERIGAAPHLSDYWQVVSRRLWLVLVIFTITTASSIWAVSRQRVFYQGHMTLQINDPLSRQRGLVTGTRVSGMDIYVDPIQSEIQVLRSSSIASEVVDSLGLRLERVPPDALRSELARDIRVAPDAPDGRYQLVYDAPGNEAKLRDSDGKTLGSAAVGAVLDAGFVRFTLQTPPDERRIYDLDIVPTADVEGEISLAAAPRENTNIIDVSVVHPDPVLVPSILNQAGRALREKGAERIRKSARADVDFINQRLDSARKKLDQSQEAIQNFKKTKKFTSLSDREQELVNRSQQISQGIQNWDSQRKVLADLVHDIQTSGVGKVDLVSVVAQLPDGADQQVRTIVGEIQDKKAEERRLLTEERQSPGHPQVVAVRAEIDQLGKQLTDAASAGLGVVEGQLRALTDQQAQVRQQQAQFPELEGELQSLQAQQSLDRDSYQFLVSQLYQSQITLAAASPFIDILDPAGGASRIQSRGRVNVFLGALLGLILGVGAAFFLEYLDRTVRTSSDVESLLGIPVLGVIPRLRRIEEEGEEASGIVRGLPLVVALDPLDPAAEAYRNLRMNLMFMSTKDDPIHTVLFSSPGPSEGKSTTAVNFAVMLAQQGQRVLLVDADLRRPSLHRALDVLREPGLTNLLIGDADARETVRPNVLPNLDFLPSGPFPPNPSELLNSKVMGRIIEEFERRYDQIVIDSPPVLAVTDAAILSVHTDGAVLVLRSGETEQRAAERSVDQLRRVGVRVFGAVLNEVSAASPDESYYLQYYYSYHPSPGGGWKRLREGLSRVIIW
jgi:capsular exopolysaccharide synthesis family protein